MAVEKILEYKHIDGVTTVEIKLNRVAEDSGNYLIHRDILRHQLSQKQGTVSTKTRSEVRGGGKKPWQQKGTGRARAGSSRSPLWRGGGVIFGPKPKTTKLKLNKKERKSALQTLLYNKRKNINVYSDLDAIAITAKQFRVWVDQIHQQTEKPENQKILVVVYKKTAYLKRASKNLKNVELIASSHLNTLSLLKADRIILTSSAVKDIKEIYCD